MTWLSVSRSCGKKWRRVISRVLKCRLYSAEQAIEIEAFNRARR
jgi:hypothetical protein